MPESTDPNTTEETVDGAAAEATADTDAAAPADADASADADVTADEAADQAAGAAEDDPVAQLQAELDERTSDLQRVSAEFANYRRRVDRDRAFDRATAKASVASELIVLADDLDRAEQHGDLEEGPLSVFAGKFRTMLEGLGVEGFCEPGDEFDPDIHEAVQDSSTGDEQVIATVLRKGYRMEDRLLRTAMVVIGDPQN